MWCGSLLFIFEKKTGMKRLILTDKKGHKKTDIRKDLFSWFFSFLQQISVRLIAQYQLVFRLARSRRLHAAEISTSSREEISSGTRRAQLLFVSWHYLGEGEIKKRLKKKAFTR